MVTEDLLLQEDLVQIWPMINEANAMSEEMDKKTKFEIALISPQARGKKDGRTEVGANLMNLCFASMMWGPDFGTSARTVPLYTTHLATRLSWIQTDINCSVAWPILYFCCSYRPFRNYLLHCILVKVLDKAQDNRVWKI